MSQISQKKEDLITRYCPLPLAEFLLFLLSQLIFKDWLFSSASPYPYKVIFFICGSVITALCFLLMGERLSKSRVRKCSALLLAAFGIGILVQLSIFALCLGMGGGAFGWLVGQSKLKQPRNPVFVLVKRISIFILIGGLLVLICKTLLPSIPTDLTDDVLLGTGLGTTNSDLLGLSFAARLVSEWGLLAVIALDLVLFSTLACAALVLWGPTETDNRNGRVGLCSVSLGLLYGLFVVALKHPAFLTTDSVLGTWGLMLAIAAIGIAAAPTKIDKPSSASQKQAFLTPKRRGVLGVLAACIAVAVFTVHITLQRRITVSTSSRAHSGDFASLTSVSQPMQDATVAMEDHAFYEHHGFDWIAMHHALRVDLREGAIKEGGSTLTQQLAKNLFLSNDRTIGRKLEEAALTVELEHQLTKPQILEFYLNSIDYGMGQQGITNAARYYFHKTPAQLTVPESAILVGLVPDPMHQAVDLQRVAQGEQTALGRMTFFFPKRYSQTDIDRATAIPLDKLLYPYKDAWDRGATDEIPATWHGVGFYFFADPNEPLPINQVSNSLKPELALFLEEARQKYHVIGIDHLGVYNDRPTRQSQKIVSAHAFGQAIDISGFRFQDGSRVSVQDHTKPACLRRLTPLEDLLKKHFDIVVDWRDDPLRHQTHFHAEVHGPRNTTVIEPASEAAVPPSNAASRFVPWDHGQLVRQTFRMSCGPACWRRSSPIISIGQRRKRP